MHLLNPGATVVAKDPNFIWTQAELNWKST